MKKLLIAALMFVSVPALACEPNCAIPTLQLTERLNDSQAQGQQQGQEATSESNATTANSGNGNSITFNSATPSQTSTNVHYSGSQTIKNVPSVSGPPLTTSNDTCMGSTSGSVNIAGLGIGGGSTWTDTNCKRLKNARELWNMGMKAAGMALMCKDAENREALEATGFVCPATNRKESNSAGTAANANSLIGQ